MITRDTAVVRDATQFANTMEFRGHPVTLYVLDQAVGMLDEELKETKDALLAMADCIIGEAPLVALDKSREDVIDGFGDIAFLAINGIYKTFRYLGDNHTESTYKTLEVLNRICRANLAKRDESDLVEYDAKGKIVKPKGWEAPTYADLL